MSSSATVNYAVFSVLAGANIMGNGIVFGSLYKITQKVSCLTFLLQFLHLTSALEGFFTLPFIFQFNEGFCTFIANLSTYFSLMNVLVVALLIESHSRYILGDPLLINEKIRTYGPYFLIIFPLIIVFANINNDLSVDSGAFCATPVDLYDPLLLALFYVWAWIAFAFCVLRVCLTLFSVYRMDPALFRKFFTSMSLYIIISVYCWVTRLVFMFRASSTDDADDTDTFGADSIYFAVYGPINIGGILYSLVYLKERKGLKLFDMYNSVGRDASVGSQSIFSWEDVISQIPRGTDISLSSIRKTTPTENPLQSSFDETMKISHVSQSSNP